MLEIVIPCTYFFYCLFGSLFMYSLYTMLGVLDSHCKGMYIYIGLRPNRAELIFHIFPLCFMVSEPRVSRIFLSSCSVVILVLFFCTTYVNSSDFLLWLLRRFVKSSVSDIFLSSHQVVEFSAWRFDAAWWFDDGSGSRFLTRCRQFFLPFCHQFSFGIRRCTSGIRTEACRRRFFSSPLFTDPSTVESSANSSALGFSHAATVSKFLF